MNNVCTYRSGYSDSGDRGADMHDHNRSAHPDHTHVWGPSSYDWEQKGVEHLVVGTRDVRAPREETVTRCQECAIRPDDVSTCG